MNWGIVFRSLPTYAEAALLTVRVALFGIAGALSTWSSLAAHLGPLLRTSRAQFVRSICATTLCGYAAILIGLSV